MNIFSLNYIILWLFFVHGFLLIKFADNYYLPLFIFLISFFLEVLLGCTIGSCACLILTSTYFNIRKRTIILLFLMSFFLRMNHIYSPYVLFILFLKLNFIKYI